MEDGRVLLIANPAAQRGNGLDAGHIAYDLLCEWLGKDRVDFKLTDNPGHAEELAAHAPTSEYGTVIALGGDGMAHETVNGLMKLDSADRPCFGLIPVGSGNDFANTLGMSDCVPDAIVQFLDADIVPFDIGRCNDAYFDETLSFGLDAAIALDTIERRKHTEKQGMSLYFASGIDQLLHHLDTFQVTAVLDGDRRIEGPVHLFAVQLGPTYGGGFLICPDADPTDGLFDICYADSPMNLVEASFKFLMAKKGRHVNFKGIHFERASSIELSFDRRPPCQIDGEEYLADSYSIQVIPKALKVLRAKD